MSAMSMRQKGAIIFFFLISGAINTLTKKYQMGTCSSSLYPTGNPVDDKGVPICPSGEKQFNKPWTQNMFMFFGESLLLWLVLYHSRKAMAARDVTLPEEGEQGVGEGEPQTKAPFYIFLLPASCDVLGTGVGGVGMQYISATVWQMMRGSLVIFTAILSVAFLKKKLYCYNWTGVTLCLVGLTFVGYSAVLDADQTDTAQISGTVMLGGIFLTVLSQLFAGFQMVIEELFVCGKYKCSPAMVVGSEGVWGMIIMVFVLFVMFWIPGDDAGSYENPVDSAHLLVNSAPLLGFVLLYCFSISLFNFLGVTMAGQMSSVTRTINDATRTLIVWGVQLGLFYFADNDTYGTPWKAHSYLQLLGFCFLILGNLVNQAIVKLPFLYYPEADDSAAEEVTKAAAASEGSTASSGSVGGARNPARVVLLDA